MARSAQRSRGFMCVPTFTVQPSISGTAKVGLLLTGASGTIANGSVTARRWLRDGVAISGATAATYTVVSADIGHVIAFEVTASATLVAANTAKAVSPPTVAAVA